jgi:ATP-dependent RNA helicase DeaD
VGRGIDFSNISHIINFDIPQFSDDYVHRVGRTGRMGREGIAFTFVTPEEGPQLTRIEQRINRLLVRDEVPGVSTAAPLAAAADVDVPLEPEPEEKPPPTDVLRRPPKRYRRAL